MTSLFTRKKKEEYQPNMTSAQTGKAVYGGSYQAPNIVGNMTRAIQSTAFPTQQKTTSSYFSKPTPAAPQMSMAPKQVQASGYGSQYASNPTNYKAPAPVAPPAPKPTAPAPTAMDAQTKAINDYLLGLKQQTADREATTLANATKNQQLLEQRYNLAGQAIRNQAPALRSNVDRFRANTEADIADVTKQGEFQKDQAKDYYGEANRTALQVRQETGAQARRKFANQGAVDGYGEGSYREADANIDSEFNRVVTENAKSLAGKQSEIDMAVGQYTRQAKKLVQEEEAKLLESLKAIEIQYADNEIAKQQATQQVVEAAQERVNAIQDKMAEIEQTAMKQKQDIAIELEKLNTTKFSPEFMATGVPTSQAEYEFMVKNGDAFEKLGLTNGGSDQNKGKVVDAINRLASGDIGAITGVVRSGWMPGTSGAQTLNDWKNLQAMLSLENRQQLKGSGAISDFEARILERASNLGLDQNLSETQFRDRLNILQSEINGGQIPGGASTGQMVTMKGIDGRTYQVDQSEVQEATANGWRVI